MKGLLFRFDSEDWTKELADFTSESWIELSRHEQPQLEVIITTNPICDFRQRQLRFGHKVANSSSQLFGLFQ